MRGTSDLLHVHSGTENSLYGFKLTHVYTLQVSVTTKAVSLLASQSGCQLNHFPNKDFFKSAGFQNPLECSEDLIIYARVLHAQIRLQLKVRLGGCHIPGPHV